MGPYESPTFLGRKDKIAMGMSMGELMKAIVLLMGLLLFWLLLLDYVGLIVCGLGFVVSLIGAIVIATVKIGGVKIPIYVVKMVKMSFRRPAYVAEALGALQVFEPTVDVFDLGSGVPEEKRPPPSLLRRLLFRGKDQAMAVARDQDKRYMAKAQIDSVSANAVTEGRRQMRSLLKEFKAFLPKIRR